MRPMELRTPPPGPAANRLFLLGGPLTGITTVQHSFKLTSVMDDTAIDYTSKSTHLDAGAQVTAGYLLTKNLQLSLNGRAFWGTPLNTDSTVNEFTVKKQDLRFRSSELEIDKLTGSAFGSWSCSAGIQFSL